MIAEPKDGMRAFARSPRAYGVLRLLKTGEWKIVYESPGLSSLSESMPFAWDDEAASQFDEAPPAS